jgi:filamentous hemagglutinin
LCNRRPRFRERWAANRLFLDRLIGPGDDVVLATRADLARPGSYYAREIGYMLQRGYRISPDGYRLLPMPE